MDRKQFINQCNHRIYILRTITAFLFLFLLGSIVIGNILFKDRSFSETENRSLEKHPSISWRTVTDGTYMKQYETYTEDQFIFRDSWLTLKAGIDDIIGLKCNNGVFLGSDHYLLENIVVPDRASLNRNLSGMIAFHNRHKKTPMHLVLVPNAANILSDKLPANAPVANQNKYFKQVSDTLHLKIDCISVNSILKKHKNEDIFYKTDHHYTTKGAYYCFQEIAKSLGIKPDLSYEKVCISDSFNGTLTAKSGHETHLTEPMYLYLAKKDKIQTVVNYVTEQKKTASLYDQTKLKTKDKYAIFLGGNYPLVDIRTTSKKKGRLLVIKDSYANSLVPFLVPYFREIVLLDPRYFYDDIDSVMNDYSIDQVLFYYNGNTFFEDNSINLALQKEK